VSDSPNKSKVSYTYLAHNINAGFGEELPYAQNLSLAAEFLNNTQFNQTVGLCREAPNAANNTYWLVNDNLLAYHALKYYYNETAETVYNTMKNYGYFRSYKIEVLFGTTIPYVPFGNSTFITIAKIGDAAIKTEVCNGTEILNSTLWADLCVYAALYYHWIGHQSEAIDYFKLAEAKWDGKGLADESFKNSSTYSTFKLAMLLYCSRILNQQLSNKTDIEQVMWLMQDETGGLHTNYATNLNYTGSDVNTETTALAILAYQYEPKVANRPGLRPLDLNVPPDSQEIQEAINVANPEDKLFIFHGTYYENLVVNKTVSLIGESKNTAIVDGKGSRTVIEVNSSNSAIGNLTIRNSGQELNGEWPCGILLDSVSNCNLTDNIITNNTLGIYLDSSTSNTLKNNNMAANRYNFGVLGLELSHYFQDVDTSNLVDGKPVYYWVNHHDEEVPSSAGYVALINSTNITVRNLGLENNLAGMNIAYSRNSTITNNLVSENFEGIWLLFSSDNTVSNNNITANGLASGFGVGVFNSSRITISDNMISANNGDGISLYGFSDHNIIVRNNIIGNSLKGIDLYDASYNDISWNIIANHTESTWFSVELDYFSNYNNIWSNEITDNGNGISIESWSSHNKVYENLVKSCGWYGIDLISNANYNSISGNTITKNDGPGIRLSGSFNNTVVWNNFVDNAQQVNTDGVSNFWDNGIEGNYWSDYVGNDTNYDGIGDIQCEFNSYNIDHYPLMGMFFPFHTRLGDVNVISNSTVEDFAYLDTNGTIKMHVSNMTSNQAYGFCRVCVAHALMNVSGISIIIDNGQTLVLHENCTLYDNGTHRWIYFAYQHSVHDIAIVTEFSLFIILLFFFFGTLLTVVVYRKKVNWHQT
jgi:parallel beta-helix repeat protein